MRFNCVRFVSETFLSTASAGEILDYYRDQMAARGWEDTTERTFELEPERQALGEQKQPSTGGVLADIRGSHGILAWCEPGQLEHNS